VSAPTFEIADFLEGGRLQMATATGQVIETPTQEAPFKAQIFTDGKIIQERFFETRPDAEAYLVETLRELERTAKSDPPRD
jgi:hypothetical protein